MTDERPAFPEAIARQVREDIEEAERDLGHALDHEGIENIVYENARARPDERQAELRAFIERQADLIHDRHSGTASWRTCDLWMCSEARAALAVAQIPAQPLLEKSSSTVQVPAQEERLAAARFVATHWRDAVMASDTLRNTGMSHPLACVLTALDGETDPAQLGISEDQHDAFRRALGIEPKEEGAG